MEIFKKINFYFFLILLDSFYHSNAQGIWTAKIIDKNTKEGIPLAYVNLIGLHQVIIADSVGVFKLAAKVETNLQISALGYNTQIIQVFNPTIKTIELEKTDVELPEIVVTGTTKATEIKKTPFAIVSINKEFLITNFSTNLFDAISLVPGVNAITTGPNISKPFIRGLGNNRILTLFDGVRQEGQQWGDEHGIEMDTYSVDKIEIIKGPASLMYGSDALAGVVNVIPTLPQEQRKLMGSAVSEFQLNNKLIGNSIFLSGNNASWEWGVRFSKRRAIDYRNKIDGRVYNTAFDETNFNVFTGIHRNWGYSHLNLSLYKNLQEIPDGSRDSLSRKFTKAINDSDTSKVIVSNADLNTYKIGVLHQNVQHFRLFWKNSINIAQNRLDLNFAYQNSLRQEFSHVQNPLISGLYLKLQTLNYDLKYFIQPINGWHLDFGINGMLQNNNAAKGTEFVIPSFKQFDFGIYSTIKKEFGKLNFSSGLRFDFRHFESFEMYVNQDPVTRYYYPSAKNVTSLNLFKSTTNGFHGLTGSTGISYIINKKFSAKLNLSRAFRAPNVSEITANGVHPGTGIYQYGNSNFNPEFSNEIDLGINYVGKSFVFASSAFVNKFDNYIFNSKLKGHSGEDSLVNNFPAYQFKQGNALLYGFEMNLDFHFVKKLHFDNSVSTVFANNYSFVGSERNASNKYLPFIPPLKFNSELKYSLDAVSGFIKIQLKYSAAQNRFYSYNNTETYTKSYTTINLIAGRKINFGTNQNLNVLFAINNLFDVAYQDNLSRLKYFENYSASPNGKLGIFNMGRNISLKIYCNF